MRLKSLLLAATFLFSTDQQTGHYLLPGHLKQTGWGQEADSATREQFFSLLTISGCTS